jgi:CRP-like cAMP-binding protein
MTLLVDRLRSRSPLAAEEREAILNLEHRIEEFETLRYLVREGDKPSRCYVLLEGYAYRHKIVAGGARQIVGIHIRGDLIDLQNSMLDVSDENVQAMTRVKVASIAVASLGRLLESFPAIANAVLKEALVYSAIFSEWIANVGRRDSRSRMAHILCELSVRQKVAGLSADGDFHLPMTQEQLGDALGLTSVHVNRTLQGLEKDGLISRNKRTIRINEWEALTRVGDFRPTYLHLQSVHGAAADRQAGLTMALRTAQAIR